MELLFWLSIGFVAYVYAGYPLILELWARSRKDRHRGADETGLAAAARSVDRRRRS